MLKYLGAFIVWNLAASAALVYLPPASGLPAMLALSAALLWGSLLRGRRPARHCATLRLRPLQGDSLRWTLAGLPVFLAFNAAFSDLYVRLVPVPPETFEVPIQQLMLTPIGRLTFTMFAVGVGPLIEELVFRGVLQRNLERRWGFARALGFSAVAFGALHGHLLALPLYVFLGLAFGFVAFATRSIWAGLILHAANNSLAMLSLASQGMAVTTAMPTVWVTGPTREMWLSLLAALATGALLVWVSRQLWSAGTGHGLRHAAADE